MQTADRTTLADRVLPPDRRRAHPPANRRANLVVKVATLGRQVGRPTLCHVIAGPQNPFPRLSQGNSMPKVAPPSFQ